MTSKANTPKDYIKELSVGFEAGMGYRMLNYHVLHRIYPNGYHCNPKLLLPFVNLASQKNFVEVPHGNLCE